MDRNRLQLDSFGILDAVTKVDEVLEILRDGIEDRLWGEVLPPAVQLASELHVQRRPLRSAIDILVAEGEVVRSGNTYVLASVAVPAYGQASSDLHRRSALVAALYDTGVTPTQLNKLSGEDLEILTAAADVDPYSLLRLAIRSFRGPSADAVRSALGYRDSTSSHTTRPERRAALADETGVSMGELGRLERIGAVALASHIESVVSLYADGYLRLDLDTDHTPAPSAIRAQLDDLAYRIRTLELGER